MKFKIFYRKWKNTSENLDYFGEKITERKFTKREAIEHLRRNGFTPWGNKELKLPSVFTNSKGIMAYVLSEKEL